MTVGTNSVPSSPAELLGDPHPLLDQLGAPDDLAASVTVSGAMDFQRVTDLPSVRSFLNNYRVNVLVPIELPAIVSAYQYAARGELKELLALDKKLSAETALRNFGGASFRVGQRQLSKLRPMRDQRLVQRYLAAIEEGQAHGWHTLVYGVSLAMFSLPLRQGLQHYVERTMLGFVDASAKSLRLSEIDSQALLTEQTMGLSNAIAGALPLTVS